VASLSPAARARTALAACSWLSWSPAESNDGWAPYFEQGGAPVLLVERQTSVRLLSVGYAEAELVALPELGIVRLGGALWPVAGNAYLEAVRHFRLEHAECVDCCGPRRSHLVGIRVESVEVVDPSTGWSEAVDLDAYATAAPDPILAHSLNVRAHLNTGHSKDLVRLASRMLDIANEKLVAAAVEWIDAWGLELAVIDDQGATTHRLPFRRPLTTMDDLGGQLHALLNRSGCDPC
jgi:hypothetical protein